MLSFKEYLLESILYGSQFQKDGHLGFLHTHAIDGNEVKIWYSPHEKKGHYSVDLSVNGQIHGRQAPGKVGHKVATFIKASVNRFIDKEKPGGLYAKGIENKKDNLYSKYWDHLSKKRGYTTSYDKDWGYGLHIK